MSEYGPMFTPEDQQYMSDCEISLDQVNAQLAMFAQGIPYANLSRACTIGDGLVTLKTSELDQLASTFHRARLAGRVIKFVPASGAASRMFKALLSCHEYFQKKGQSGSSAPLSEGNQKALKQFISEIHHFGFYHDLAWIMKEKGLDIERLINNEEYGPILEYLLTAKGLNYAVLPKGLLQFHRYLDHVRTPLEEHLVEAKAYTLDQQNKASVHFTVSPEHEPLMKAHLKKVSPRHERDGVSFTVMFSNQKPSTNTIAANLENQPFRDHAGTLVFRPGGHGALIENLNDLQGDIVFIKNIDNIVPDHLKDAVTTWKFALGGYLVSIQDQIFHFMDQLMDDQTVPTNMSEMANFASQKLSIDIPENFRSWGADEQTRFLKDNFDRPLRVCGMVRNSGEPGGGPFWVTQEDGLTTPQIVESSQVDPDSPEQQRMLSTSTHFNPVDVVCGVRDYRGKPFDLRQFTDPNTGFISEKSFQGKTLKALELPGLWNGGMARWNTVFVEVPASTFNPVKTVLDLLRPEHQPA